MEPGQVKEKIQSAFRAAISNTSTQWSHDDGVGHIFRDVRLYGREAGVDFVTPHLNAIVDAAVKRAECKDVSLQITLYGFGHAAVEGVEETLQSLTGLPAHRTGSNVILTWASTAPQLI